MGILCQMHHDWTGSVQMGKSSSNMHKALSDAKVQSVCTIPYLIMDEKCGRCIHYYSVGYMWTIITSCVTLYRGVVVLMISANINHKY